MGEEEAPTNTLELEEGAWPGSVRASFPCFHTHNILTIDPVPEARRLLNDAYELCLRLEALFAPLDPASELHRINEEPGPFTLSVPFAELLTAALSFSREEPTFDCTIGASSYLWKWAETVPDDEEVARAHSHVGRDLVVLEHSVLKKLDPQTQLDFGSCAKGYATDKIAALFRAAGVEHADIDLGGNLYLIGPHPAGRPWRFVVDLPEGMRDEPVAFEAQDCSVVTSSLFERPLVFGDRRLHHLIDPRTGRPTSSSVASATVIAASSLEADILSSALLIGGMQELEALHGRHPGCGFIAVDSTGSMRCAGPVNLRG